MNGFLDKLNNPHPAFQEFFSWYSLQDRNLNNL